MSCGYCIGGVVERGAADEFPADPMARAGPGGLAADLRYRGTGRAFVPHRRTGKSLCLPVAWPGPDLGDRAAAAHDLADRHLRDVLRHDAGLPALRFAV